MREQKKPGAIGALVSQQLSQEIPKVGKKQIRVDDPDRREKLSPDQVRAMLMPRAGKGKRKFDKHGKPLPLPGEYEGIGSELERMAKCGGPYVVPSPRVLYVAEALKRWEAAASKGKPIPLDWAFMVEPGDGRPRKDALHLEVAVRIAEGGAYLSSNMDKIDAPRVRALFNLKPDANTTEYQRIWASFGARALVKYLSRKQTKPK
jgi:hypothetical protein